MAPGGHGAIHTLWIALARPIEPPHELPRAQPSECKWRPSIPYFYFLRFVVRQYIHVFEADPIRGTRQFMGRFTRFTWQFKDLWIGITRRFSGGFKDLWIARTRGPMNCPMIGWIMGLRTRRRKDLWIAFDLWIAWWDIWTALWWGGAQCVSWGSSFLVLQQCDSIGASCSCAGWWIAFDWFLCGT